jgi:hypothetical protein
MLHVTSPGAANSAAINPSISVDAPPRLGMQRNAGTRPRATAATRTPRARHATRSSHKLSGWHGHHRRDSAGIRRAEPQRIRSTNVEFADDTDDHDDIRNQRPIPGSDGLMTDLGARRVRLRQIGVRVLGNWRSCALCRQPMAVSRRGSPGEGSQRVIAWTAVT